MPHLHRKRGASPQGTGRPAPALLRGSTGIVTHQGQAMGGGWTLRQPADTPAGAATVQAALDLVDAQMSAWRADSVLSLLNAAPLGVWVPIPPEMERVLHAGLSMMRRLPDAFSVLMGGASAAAGFQPGRVCAVGDTADLIETVPGAARRMADVALDLNAMAKGLSADLAAARLRDAGHADFLIEVAGDIFAQGSRPDGLPWTAAMELPIPGHSVPASLVPVIDAGLACSGGYRRASGGGCHILNPATGLPLAETLASVAVLAPSAMAADGWATALSVLGPQRGMEIAAREALPVIFISTSPDGEGFVEAGSPAMADLLFQTASG